IGIVELPPWLVDIEPSGYSIDSRRIQPGEVFFAIKGEKFDGHDFVSGALTRGAAAAVVSRDRTIESSLKERLITVDDTLVALQRLASGVLKKWGRPIIGITGSVGKTTTKELTALVLTATGHVLK